MKHRLILLGLMACFCIDSVHAQVLLPTKKKAKEVTEETLPQQQTEQPPTQPANGGAVVLPTRRANPSTPVGEQPQVADTTSATPRMAPLPVVRRHVAPRAIPIVKKPKVEDNNIYESADKMPTYPGGVTELMAFINDRLEYPREALADSAQGIVQVSFIVEKDGTPTEFEVLDEHHPALEAEAVRVLQQMPKWKPATQRGVKVRVEYVVPVKFTIPNI